MPQGPTPSPGIASLITACLFSRMLSCVLQASLACAYPRGSPGCQLHSWPCPSFQLQGQHGPKRANCTQVPVLGGSFSLHAVGLSPHARAGLGQVSPVSWSSCREPGSVWATSSQGLCLSVGNQSPSGEKRGETGPLSKSSSAPAQKGVQELRDGVGDG